MVGAHGLRLHALQQTIIRQLKHWQMKDPSLNPFIEMNKVQETAYSGYAFVPNSSSAPCEVCSDDVVIDGLPSADEPLRPEFLQAVRAVAAISGPSLVKLQSADLTTATPSTLGVLRAVSLAEVAIPLG